VSAAASYIVDEIHNTYELLEEGYSLGRVRQRVGAQIHFSHEVCTQFEESQLYTYLGSEGYLVVQRSIDRIQGKDTYNT